MWALHILCALCFSLVAAPDRLCVDELAAPDPLFFLRHRDITASMGSVVSKYDETLQTRIYFSLSEPDREGEIPLVGPQARAAVIYFHGSGTKKASGKGFLQKMQSLIAAGLAPVSVDLPFHSEGPINSQYFNLNYFMQWVDRLVERLLEYRKPIYLVGHSFGPFVIQEYLAHFPNKIQGALLISASGSYHPALRYTYQNITIPGMPYIDATLAYTEHNELGGQWAGTVENQATWVARPAPPLPLIFLRGTQDEWFPENTTLPRLLRVEQPHSGRVVEEWLKIKYPTAQFIFVENTGHYIFDAKDSQGQNIIVKTLFDLIGVPENDRFREPRVRRAPETVALYYHTNAYFQAWIGPRYIHAIQNAPSAEQTLRGWRLFCHNEWREIFIKIPEIHPGFFSQRRISWHILKQRLDKEGEKKEPDINTDTDTRVFQAEFQNYLEANQRFQTLDLGPDRMRPPPPAVPESLFTKGDVFRGEVAGPVIRSAFEETLRDKNGTISRIEPIENLPLIRLSYSIAGSQKNPSVVLFDEIDKVNIFSIIEEAYLNAREQNGFRPLPKNWEGAARGIHLRGTQVENAIQTLVIEAL